MNLISIFNQFPNQQSCIAHLEAIRWPEIAFCPHCQSDNVARKIEGARVGRWNCHNCMSSFNVMSGTIFQGTSIPLQKWFLAISLMVNAKKSLSSYQLSRDLELNQKTAYNMQQRIRAAVASDERALLHGIIEADETYVGGKPRYNSKTNKRGRVAPGKTSVVRAVEREGEVRAEVTDDTKGRTTLGFIQRSVDTTFSALITDEYRAYTNAARLMLHAFVDHSEGYASPDNRGVHTNTIEGFWSLLKRAWYGSHHKYTKGWSPLFVAEAVWKYNHRRTTALTAYCGPALPELNFCSD